MVCAGYKMAAGRLVQDFFWAKSEHLGMARPGPFYGCIDGIAQFRGVISMTRSPAATRNGGFAGRASYFNFNLVPWSFRRFVVRMGPNGRCAQPQIN